jgi:hypothetical protein
MEIYQKQKEGIRLQYKRKMNCFKKQYSYINLLKDWKIRGVDIKNQKHQSDPA